MGGEGEGCGAVAAGVGDGAGIFMPGMLGSCAEADALPSSNMLSTIRHIFALIGLITPDGQTAQKDADAAWKSTAPAKFAGD